MKASEAIPTIKFGVVAPKSLSVKVVPLPRNTDVFPTTVAGTGSVKAAKVSEGSRVPKVRVPPPKVSV